MLDLLETATQKFADTVTATLGPIASFLEYYVWSWPPQAPILMVVLLGTGLYVTLRLGFIQIRGFKHAIEVTSGKYDNPEDEGDLKHFQALTTALSATVGIGNIAGVAIAIRMGGPGALFWMWVTAFFGMALKFAECTLATAYRKVLPDGSVSGGPMYYIEKGLGKKFKPLAVFFAVATIICSFGTGNMNQSNTMTDAIEEAWGITPTWTALLFAIVVWLVIVGGIKRIGKVTAVLAPFMAIFYVISAIAVMIINIEQLPSVFLSIIKNAFAPEPIAGGAAGSFIMTLMWGIRRGLFSNEAGQGSAPIAHAAAKTKEPVREGLVASLGPFIDTIVICSMTGFVILVSQAHLDTKKITYSSEQISIKSDTKSLHVVEGKLSNGTLFSRGSKLDNPTIYYQGTAFTGKIKVEGEKLPQGFEISVDQYLTGAPLTAWAFKKSLPGQRGDIVVTIAVLLFAVSTAISWSYYGDRATEYLFGREAVKIYRWIYVFFFFLGGILPLKAVWTFGDVALGLMSFPNLLAVFLLTGKVTEMTREYLSRMGIK